MKEIKLVPTTEEDFEEYLKKVDPKTASMLHSSITGFAKYKDNSPEYRVARAMFFTRYNFLKKLQTWLNKMIFSKKG